MLIHTSKTGYVTKIFTSPGVAAYLYDFDIDGHDLKSSHKDWLNHDVVGHLKKSPELEWNVFLEGTASYTGGIHHNVDLSQRRAEEVGKYLQAKVLGKNLFIDTTARGYTKTALSGKPYGT